MDATFLLITGADALGFQSQATTRLDNGKEFWGRAIASRAHVREGGQLFLIEPGKPNQNVYIESFNGRFRDECLNGHWFTTLRQARVIVEAWRREYNEERKTS